MKLFGMTILEFIDKKQGDWSEVFSRVEKDCSELIKNISDLRQS